MTTSGRPPASPGAERPTTSDRRDAAGVFRPITHLKAADGVVEQIGFAIRSSIYRVGERLPSLPDLADAMGVSRPTVGEALHRLVDVGVLDVRRGANGGIVVVSNNVPARALRPQPGSRGTFRELIEARRPIEMELTRLAAVRATEADFKALDRAHEELLASRGSRDAWGHLNNLFHYGIGRAARSDTLAYFQHRILQEIAHLLDSWSERYSDPELTIREHADTLAALRTRDPDVATVVMDQHLKELEGVAVWFDDERERGRDARTDRTRTSGRTQTV